MSKPRRLITAALSAMIGIGCVVVLGATLAKRSPARPTLQSASAANLPLDLSQNDAYWQRQVHMASRSAPVVLPTTLAPSTTTTARATTTSTSSTTSTSRSTITHSASAATRVVSSGGYTTACYPSVGMAPRNRTEACISNKENGGCYGRSNNGTHFGRWQFDWSTWVGNGGSRADWGYASPSEQDQVFRNTVAADGYGQWTNYDGC